MRQLQIQFEYNKLLILFFMTLQCSVEFCDLMKVILIHIRNCTANEKCSIQYCWTSRLIMSHWRDCIDMNCPVCRQERINVANFLAIVTGHPRWKLEIETRFQWLVSVLCVHQTQPAQRNLIQQQQQRQRNRVSSAACISKNEE